MASEKKITAEPFHFHQVGDVEPCPQEQTWLIKDIWLASGVGLLGGQAKVCKTFLAAELSIAVATGQPALGCFETHLSGSVLFFGAEDSLPALRNRFDGLAKTRGCDISKLSIFLIDVPVLRLDQPQDLQRLRAAIKLCKPRLLVLDPFVRLVSHVDENSAADVSAVLGELRAIQRDYDLALLLVHHARKSPASHPNQAFRGSSDFAAWSDSNLFLSPKKNHLELSIEHRAARSPDPIALQLKHEPAPHLVVIAKSMPQKMSPHTSPLAAQIQKELQNVARPLTTAELRDLLRRRKAAVVQALEALRTAGVISRTSSGWKLASA